MSLFTIVEYTIGLITRSVHQQLDQPHACRQHLKVLIKETTIIESCWNISRYNKFVVISYGTAPVVTARQVGRHSRLPYGIIVASISIVRCLIPRGTI